MQSSIRDRSRVKRVDSNSFFFYCILTNIKYRVALCNEISNDVKCMCECQEVSNTALHNFPRPQAFKEEIRNDYQDQRKIFDPGGI